MQIQHWFHPPWFSFAFSFPVCAVSLSHVFANQQEFYERLVISAFLSLQLGLEHSTGKQIKALLSSLFLTMALPPSDSPPSQCHATYSVLPSLSVPQPKQPGFLTHPIWSYDSGAASPVTGSSANTQGRSDYRCFLQLKTVSLIQMGNFTSELPCSCQCFIAQQPLEEHASHIIPILYQYQMIPSHQSRICSTSSRRV